MTPEEKEYFTEKFIERGLDPAYVDNIILTCNKEDECYNLDCIDYDLFADTVYPDAIDEILSEYMSS